MRTKLWVQWAIAVTIWAIMGFAVSFGVFVVLNYVFGG